MTKRVAASQEADGGGSESEGGSPGKGGAELATVSRARAPACGREEADRRIAQMAECMARGEWCSAQAKEFAEEWGITVRSVREYGRIASRLVWTAGTMDLEELKRETLTKLQEIAERAEANGELQAAIKALDTAAEITGIKAPRQQRIAHSAEGGAGLVIFLPAEDPRDLEPEDE